MKVFSKFLAVILALVTMLTLIPFSVFAKASEPWLEVEGSEGTDAPVLTVKVDADALMALLRADDASSELLDTLQSGIALDFESLTQVFSIEELFEIIPSEELFKILSIEQIVKEIGLKKLESYIDKSALIENVSKNDLAALLSDIDNLAEVVDMEAALKTLDKSLLLKHIDKDAVYGEIDIEDAIELLGGYAKALEYVNVDGLLADPSLDMGALVSCLDTAKLVEKIGLDALKDYVDIPALVEGLDDASVEALLGEISELGKVVDASAALKLIDKALILKYTDEDAVFEKVDLWKAVDLVFGSDSFDIAALKNTVDLKALVSGTALDWAEIFDLDLLSDDTVIAKVSAFVTVDTSDVSKLEALLEGKNIADYYDAVAGTANVQKLVKDVGISKLMNSDIVEVDLDGMMAEPTIETFVFNHINLETALPKIKDSLKNALNLTDYVDKTAVFELIALEDAIELIGGYEAAEQYVNTNALLADPDLDRGALVSAVNFDKLVEEIGFEKLEAYFDLKTLVDDLSPEDKAEILESLDNVAELVDMEAAMELISSELVLKYVDQDAVLEDIEIEKAVDLIGGYDKATEFVQMESLLADPDLNMGALVDFVWLDKLIEAIGFEKIMELVSVEALIEQLDAEELYEIIQLVDMGPYVKDLLALVVRKIFSNVDEITVDGQLVAAEDSKQMLKVDSKALIEALNRVRPSLDDFINNKDGKLLSTHLSFKYTVDGTDVQKSKEMILELVVEGDISGVQKMAQKMSDLLNRYVSYSYNNGTLSADITIPAKFAELFNRVLDTDRLDADTKEKLLIVAAWGDSEHLMGVLESLTVADVENILSSVDLEELGNIALQYEYVQECLKIASDFAGIDMTDMDVNDLLDYSVKVPGLKTISEKIQEKYGVDVYAALEKYETVDELYEAAMKKAKENVELFESVTDRIILEINTRLSDAAKDLSLMDCYQGNGLFELNKSVTVNAKELAEKALTRLVKWIGADDIGVEIIDLLLSQVSGGTKTLNLDLSIQVADVYRITYKDKDTEKTLFDAFLPVGADLSVFRQKEVDGVEIIGWADEEGNAITVMPARDVVVYAEVEGGDGPDVPPVDPEEPRKEVHVTFVNQSGATLGTVTLLSGDKLSAEQIATVDGFEALIEYTNASKQFLYSNVEVVWKVYDAATGTVGSRWMPSRTVVTDDVTVIADVTPNYYLNIDDVDYDVELNDEGNNKTFTLKIHEELPEAFVLDMDRKFLLSMAAMSYNITLEVIVGKQEYCFFTMDDALLKSLKDASTTQVTFHFGTTSANAANSIYAKDENASFYTFEIRTDGTVYDKNFVSDLYITVPYEQATTGSSSGNGLTRIHLLYADGSRELVERIGDQAGFVTFKAPHFSEYVISNEYKMNLDFVSTESSDITEIFGSWKSEKDATDTYFPAGCEIVAIPVVLGDHTNNYIWVSTSYVVGGVSGALSYGEIFVMPASEVSVTVLVKPRECNVYYYVLGVEVYKDTYFFYETVGMRAENDSAVMEKDPDGTPSAYKWIGFDAALVGKCDMYVFAKWNDATYFVEFLGRDGKPVATFAFDESNFYTVKAPAVPTEVGYVGAWEKYDLSEAFGQADGYTLKVNSVYTDAIFKIFTDGNVTVVGSAKFGDTVKVFAPDHAGYDKVILVTLADKTTQAVENGVFVMPESEVYISVSYVPHTFNYTINGFEYQGKMNDTVTFSITIPRGKVLEKTPAGCVLANAELNADGALVLTYSFELVEDGMSVNWKWKNSKYNMFQIINGSLFDGDGVPVSTNDDAVFLGWSPVVADNIQFAIFGINEEPASWLWLWILLILLVLIGVIVLFYLLYKAGKIGLNAFTRVILWIVNLFFSVCIAVAEFGLKIAGLFGKGKSNEEYGVAEADQKED